MYRAFNLTITDDAFDYDDIMEGDGLALEHEHSVSEKLSILEKQQRRGGFDGTRISQSWFPLINANVFISYSSKDMQMAKTFAGWLKRNFGLSPFIDSCVWGQSNRLLKIIDNQYCRNKSGLTYNYDKRNHSTAFVHMMVMSALAEMISRCECLFFLNTPHSITADEIDQGAQTPSPWIFAELAMAKLVKETDLDRHRQERKNLVEAGLEDFRLSIDLNALTTLTTDHLWQWHKNTVRDGAGGMQALDILYRLRPERFTGGDASVDPPGFLL